MSDPITAEQAWMKQVDQLTASLENERKAMGIAQARISSLEIMLAASGSERREVITVLLETVRKLMENE